MKDDQSYPEEPRYLFISVMGSSTSRRAPSRFVYSALGVVVASDGKNHLMWRCKIVAVS